MQREAGQASVELVAVVPALLLAGLVALQIAVAGLAMTLVDGAAEAGALALAAGTDAEAAARAALPGWARDGVDVEVNGGRLVLSLRPPSLLPGVGRLLEVSTDAWARPAPGQ